MQVAAVEFAQNVAHLHNANSTEMDLETPYPIISLLEEQHIVTDRARNQFLNRCVHKRSNEYAH